MARSRFLRGANAVEFALVLPTLMTLVSGTIDWAWYLTQNTIVLAAAREGARVTAAWPVQANAPAAGMHAASEYITNSGYVDIGEVNIDCNTLVTFASGDEGYTCEVEMPSFQPFFGFIPQTTPPASIVAQVTMRYQF